MGNPKLILQIGIGKQDKKGSVDGAISELISKAFTTRNLLHFAHWHTGSYAAHMALGDLYDQIIDDIDEIVECYIGKFGKPKKLACEAASLPKDIAAHVKSEMDWVENNRMFISKGNSSIENLIDTLLSHYQKCVYKLTNLK